MTKKLKRQITHGCGNEYHHVIQQKTCYEKKTFHLINEVDAGLQVRLHLWPSARLHLHFRTCQKHSSMPQSGVLNIHPDMKHQE